MVKDDQEFYEEGDTLFIKNLLIPIKSILFPKFSWEGNTNGNPTISRNISKVLPISSWEARESLLRLEKSFLNEVYKFIIRNNLFTTGGNILSPVPTLEYGLPPIINSEDGISVVISLSIVYTIGVWELEIRYSSTHVKSINTAISDRHLYMSMRSYRGRMSSDFYEKNRTSFLLDTFFPMTRIDSGIVLNGVGKLKELIQKIEYDY